jgi:hypothetical protein
MDASSTFRQETASRRRDKRVHKPMTAKKSTKTAQLDALRQEEHGVAEAAYVLVQSGTYFPTLICLCGFFARGETWEEAGAELDEHLEKNPQ